MNSFLLSLVVVAIVMVAAAAVVVIVYTVKILRDVRHITKQVSSETDEILADVHDARAFMKKELRRAISLKELVAPIIELVARKRRTSSRKRKKASTDNVEQ